MASLSSCLSLSHTYIHTYIHICIHFRTSIYLVYIHMHAQTFAHIYTHPLHPWCALFLSLSFSPIQRHHSCFPLSPPITCIQSLIFWHFSCKRMHSLTYTMMDSHSYIPLSSTLTHASTSTLSSSTCYTLYNVSIHMHSISRPYTYINIHIHIHIHIHILYV